METESIAARPRAREPIVVPQLADLRTRAEEFVRREPLKALLLALGAGLLAGKLLRFLTEQRKRDDVRDEA